MTERKITKKHQRYIDKLVARTLECQECKGTAYAIWSHRTDSGRGTDFFGLCEPCEKAFIAECNENVRRAREMGVPL